MIQPTALQRCNAVSLPISQYETHNLFHLRLLLNARGVYTRIRKFCLAKMRENVFQNKSKKRAKNGK